MLFDISSIISLLCINIQTSKLSCLLAFRLPFYKIMIPTVDTLRYHFLLRVLIKCKRPVLLTGPVGTGKTSVTHSVVEELDSKMWNVVAINMSAQVFSKI